MPSAVVRGGGDLATGIVYRLWKTGFSVVVLETPCPTAIRRTVSAAQAVFEGACVVQGMPVCLCGSARNCANSGEVSVLIDPEGASIAELRPDLLVDAIMAKRNCGTTKSMAACVVGVGPGFFAPQDVHAVVETLRGHDLGRVIVDGAAAKDTGVPGELAGEAEGRLVRSPADGTLEAFASIGDRVERGQVLGKIGEETVCAKIGGVLRGLIHPKVPVIVGMKIGDIDPRGVREHCFSISDKSLAIAGGVLEAAFSAII